MQHSETTAMLLIVAGFGGILIIAELLGRLVIKLFKTVDKQ